MAEVSGDTKIQLPQAEVDISDWIVSEAETTGMSTKGWYKESKRSPRFLLKTPKRDPEVDPEKHRFRSGDDWAELVASDIAQLLGMPSHNTELAIRRDENGIETRGVICKDLTSDGKHFLLLGNNFLAGIDGRYQPLVKQNIPLLYSVDFVFDGLSDLGSYSDAMAMSATDQFVGYLLFDALVCNNDRNHTNWGVLHKNQEAPGGRIELAPSFDHGSSLGWDLNDAYRESGLCKSASKRSPAGYVKGSISKFVGPDGDIKKRPNLLTVFGNAQERYPDAALHWLKQLDATPLSTLCSCVEAVPDSRMSRIAKEYAKALLTETRQQLLGMMWKDSLTAGQE